MNTIENKPAVKPDNYLVWAILSTIFCCIPFGIVGIVKASQVDTYWAQGNFAEAVQAARDAKRWTWIGVCTALGIYLIYIVIVVIGVFAAIKLG